LTAAEGSALGHDVARVSLRVLAFAYRLLFRYKNSDVSNFKPLNCNNFYIQNIIIMAGMHVLVNSRFGENHSM
jgi:hypothetical protein